MPRHCQCRCHRFLDCPVPVDGLVAYVISKNLMRRHLTYDQRVGLALKLRPVLAESSKPGRPKKNSPKTGELKVKSSEQAAQQAHVGKTSVEEMIAEERNDPEIADKLLSGEVTVKDVRKQQSRRKREEEYIQRAADNDQRVGLE